MLVLFLYRLLCVCIGRGGSLKVIDATADSKGPTKYESSRKYTAAKHSAYSTLQDDILSNTQNNSSNSSSSSSSSFNSRKRKLPLPDADAAPSTNGPTSEPPAATVGTEAEEASSALFPLPLTASCLSLTSRQRCADVCLRLLDLIQPKTAVELENPATVVSGVNSDTTTIARSDEEGGTAMHVDGVSDPICVATATATTATTDNHEITTTTTTTTEQQLAEADRRRAGLAQLCTQFLAHLTRDHLVVEHFQVNRGPKRFLATVSRFDGMSSLLCAVE